MIKYIKSLFKKPEPVKYLSPYTYKCSCGHESRLEWCEKCGIRNTSKWLNARSAHSSNSSTSVSNSYSSSDSSAYYMMSMNSSFSSSSCDSSSSSDSSSCSSGD